MAQAGAAPGEDLTPDYMNILGMIFSMCGLMMRVIFLTCLKHTRGVSWIKIK